MGGGHSHVQVLRMQAMEPLPRGARLTVVVDRSLATYSGMVPGFVAGQYSAHELHIDVRPLARQAGVRFIEARCTGIDPDARRLLLEGRPPLAYDLCSLNVGSTVAQTDLPGVREHALPTRPIGRFVDRLQARVDRAREHDRLDVVVVGGGAGGVELAFCLEARLRREGITPRVALVDGGERLFAARSERLSRKLASLAEDRGIALHLGSRVSEVHADHVLLESGEALPSGLTVWVTGAVAPAWLARTPLPTDPRGFVQVEDTLAVPGCEGLFAVGDCAVLASWPEIPKAGVYAVRQGPVLRRNLAQALQREPLEAYRPQRDFLTLLNLGDGTAVGDRSGLVFHGGAVFKLKDRIDRRFMERFQVLDATGAPARAFRDSMPAEVLARMENSEMVCGGCAAKVAETPLEAYRPQRDFLTLLNLGDGTAVGDRSGLVFHGGAVFKLKDRIDRRFMERFQVLDATGAPARAFRDSMPAEVLARMENSEMVCGGCAAKVAETPLRRALARLPPLSDPSVSMGLDASEDVAALRLEGTPPAARLVANLDAFTAFTDDPWLVGRVGAHNALSDLIATGAPPRYALALVTLPADAPQEETLFQVMSGVRESLDAEGVTLVGGHTTVGSELVVGLSVWGHVPDAAALWPKGERLAPGLALVLTRALGTGVLFHADMAGRAAGAWMAAATAGMLQGNAAAAALARALGPVDPVAAATDITGFGLAGHLGEMLRAAGGPEAISATLDLEALPALPGALELLSMGERSTFHEQNAEARKALFIPKALADSPRVELLFDPQTAGGLLLALPPDRAPALLAALHAADHPAAAVIGHTTPPREDGALFALK